MLRISWTEYNTNVWVRQKIGVPVSRFECVSGLSVYPVEIRSLNNLSISEDCSTDYCQPV